MGIRIHPRHKPSAKRIEPTTCRIESTSVDHHHKKGLTHFEHWKISDEIESHEATHFYSPVSRKLVKLLLLLLLSPPPPLSSLPSKTTSLEIPTSRSSSSAAVAAAVDLKRAPPAEDPATRGSSGASPLLPRSTSKGMLNSPGPLRVWNKRRGDPAAACVVAGDAADALEVGGPEQ